MNKSPLRLLIIDEQKVFTECFRTAIQTKGPIEVVGCYSTVADGLSALIDLRPDVIVFDTERSGSSLFEVMNDLRTRLPDTRIVVLASLFNPLALKRAVRSGVDAFLLKSDSVDDVLNALWAIQGGEKWYSLQVLEHLKNSQLESPTVEVKNPLAVLTSRQVEVLRYLAQGLSVKQIAREMHLTPKAVDSHKYRIMKALDIHDRVVLAHFAWNLGLVTSPGAFDFKIA